MSRWGSASLGEGKNDARSKDEDRCGMTRAKVERRLDREVSRSCREQEAGADRTQRHRQGLQSIQADEEKRAVLDGVAAELQRIIGEPAQHEEVAMRLAA